MQGSLLFEDSRYARTLRGFYDACIRFESVCHAPVDHVLGRLAAAGAFLAEVLLLEGDAAAGHAGLLLHIELTLEVAAPHGLDEAAVLFLQRLGLLERLRGENMAVEVGLRLVEEALLDRLEQRGDLGLKRVERDGNLLAVVASRGDALVLLHARCAAARPSSPSWQTSSRGCCRRNRP